MSSLSLRSLSFLLVLWPTLPIEGAWTCAQNASNYPVDIEKLSGTWYEVARLPDVAVPACVNVLAPATVAASNDSYDLRVNFINNVNSQWKNETETLHFPWTEEASRGLFRLTYGEGAISMSFVYRLMGTDDYENVAVICGYMEKAPAVSYLKIMTRQRNVSDAIKQRINTLVDEYAVGLSVGWVDQSERCNGASTITTTPLGASFLALATFLFLWSH